jgi:hypothetical protein
MKSLINSRYSAPDPFGVSPTHLIRHAYHELMNRGMNVAAGPELAAAVSNAGGLGVIGGLGYTYVHPSYPRPDHQDQEYRLMK